VSTDAKAAPRLAFLDAHRGLAVLLMIAMHSADGWLRPELKHGPGWDLIRSFGGLAAPAFLLLSGVSMALSWGYAPNGRAKGAPIERKSLARGLQLIVLGYALRLQMWMLDGAGYRQWEAWTAALPLALGYGAAYFALEAWGTRAPARRWVVVAAAAGTLGYAVLSVFLPERLFALLRVDVLQAIGASLAIVWCLRAPLRRVPELGLALALAVALLTPWVRAVLPGPLPVAAAAYLGTWQLPSGQTTTATLFPLFPWLSYALVGATLGLRLGRAERRRTGGATRLAIGLAAGSAGLAVLTSEALPPARWVVTEWTWSVQVIRVAFRTTATLVLGGLAVALCTRRIGQLGAGVIALGQASLIVYWVHLQFAFGAAVKPIVHQLDMGQWARGFALFAAAAIAFSACWLRGRARLRDRARSARTARPIGSDPAPMPGA
jgi:uncharacterized membrane protein